MTLPAEPPRLYFRLREPGATVYRVTTEGPGGRLDLQPLAVANLRSGEIKPLSETPDDADMAEIRNWIETRHSQRRERDLAEIDRLTESLNNAAHWLQTRASRKAVLAQSDALLFAIHDLRTALVRRLAETADKTTED
jgi:hypothetical protein